MRLIFLDIDGVLNNDQTSTVNRMGFLGLDPEILKRFNDWYYGLSNDIAIILSSTWRRHPDLVDELIENGIKILGMTPKKFGPSSNSRGQQVKSFLEETEYDVTNYVIIDDIGDWFLEEQKGHLVETDYRVGLTNEDLEKVDKILSE